MKARKISDKEFVGYESPLKALYEEAMNAVIGKDRTSTKNISEMIKPPTTTSHVDQHTIDLSSVKSFDIRDNKVCRISGKRQTIFSSVTERRNHKKQPRSISMQVSHNDFSMVPRSKSLSAEALLTGVADDDKGEHENGDSDRIMIQDCTEVSDVTGVTKDTISSSSGKTVTLDVSATDGEDKNEATEVDGDGAEKNKEGKIPEVDDHPNRTKKGSDETNEEVDTKDLLDENKNVNSHHQQHNQEHHQQKNLPTKTKKIQMANDTEKQKLLIKEKMQQKQKKGDNSYMFA